MVELRLGSCGNYYGSDFNSSESLSQDQMKVNATYIYKFLSNEGWTKNAIAGMLGNMQAESSLNPGRWQSENVGNTSGGYGLVQWTPATNYLNWCNSEGISDPSEMDSNLLRIIYELDHGLQWIATSEYDFSFEAFASSTKSPSYLASAFLKCYERAGVEVESTRQANAVSWFSFLNGSDPGSSGGSGGTTSRKKKKYKFILFNKRKRII